jgi:hypothetical protein
MIEATRAQRWRLRAAEARQAAAIMDDRKTRETLARVARTYDALALRAEAAASGPQGTEGLVPALPRHAVPV